MCLDEIGKRVKLRHDLEVWKIVELEDRKEYTKIFADDWILRQCLNFKLIRARYVGKAVSHYSRHHYAEPDSTERIYAHYISGFHCYIHKPKDTQIDTHVFSYVIPKGTTIQYGEDPLYGEEVVVTPVLINPRVRGALKLLQKGGEIWKNL